MGEKGDLVFLGEGAELLRHHAAALQVHLHQTQQLCKSIKIGAIYRYVVRIPGRW